jgi:hypothetical protein
MQATKKTGQNQKQEQKGLATKLAYAKVPYRVRTHENIESQSSGGGGGNQNHSSSIAS